MPNPYVWDYSSAVAVEVEMAPQKSREQVLKNYRKNAEVYASIRFVVTSDNNAKQLQEILGEDPKADPEKYRIDKIEFESLNDVEPARSEEPASPKVQVLEPLGTAEKIVLSLVLTGGLHEQGGDREEVRRGWARRG